MVAEEESPACSHMSNALSRLELVLCQGRLGHFCRQALVHMLAATTCGHMDLAKDGLECLSSQDHLMFNGDIYSNAWKLLPALK